MVVSHDKNTDPTTTDTCPTRSNSCTRAANYTPPSPAPTASHQLFHQGRHATKVKPKDTHTATAIKENHHPHDYTAPTSLGTQLNGHQESPQCIAKPQSRKTCTSTAPPSVLHHDFLSVCLRVVPLSAEGSSNENPPTMIAARTKKDATAPGTHETSATTLA